MNNINPCKTEIINFNIDSTPTLKGCPLELPEMLKTIFAQLDIKSLVRISQVSKVWNIESSRDEIWMLFSNEFNVKGPDFKSQIRESEVGLNKIFTQINKKMWECTLRKTFFKNLTEILFKDNIRKIEIEPFFEETGYVSFVTLTLNKEKQISFDNPKIFNIRIPEKVAFIIRPAGFTFQQNHEFWKTKLVYPIEFNCSALNFSSNFCNSIELHNSSLISLEWNHVNIFVKERVMTWTNKGSLLSPIDEKENCEMYNPMR
jgi:hypothetical protein